MPTLTLSKVVTEPGGAIHIIDAEGCGTRFTGGWPQLKEWAESSQPLGEVRDELLRDALRTYIAKGATSAVGLASLANEKVVRDYAAGKVSSIEPKVATPK
jgi:hypothetical protein